MALRQQYVIGGVDHFDPEEVVKVPQVLHLKCSRQLGLHIADCSEVGFGDDQVTYVQQYAHWTFPNEQ